MFSGIHQLLDIGNGVAVNSIKDFVEVIISATPVEHTLDLVVAKLYVLEDRPVRVERA